MATRDDVMALCDALPARPVEAGAVLLQQGVPSGRLYVVRSGRFEVVRDTVRVVTVSEPGAFLGEISALLGVPPTATVTAVEPGVVHVLDDAGTALAQQPQLVLAVARLLARRLQSVTAYLVDLQRQYAGSGSHLGLMDQVLTELMALQPPAAQEKVGSERPDVPDY